MARYTIADWFRKGWIIRGQSEYVHPLALVRKKNGKTRVCIDATGLNKILEFGNNNPPRIENLLFEPNVGKIYYSLDFSDGFMQIPLHPESYKLLGFEFEGQIYLMSRLAFGTSVSSSIFNRCARTVIFENEIYDPNVRVYVDDIKIESENFESHLQSIIVVVDRIAKAGMSLSLDKITLFEPSLNYLGFKIERDIITKGQKYKFFFEEFNAHHIQNNKIIFYSKREVQKLLGFANWYGLFVPGLVALVEPFQTLLSKNPPYVLDGPDKLYRLEEAVNMDITLTQPRSELPFYVFIQNNSRDIAGLIFQRDENGKCFVITMVNHRLPRIIIVKDEDLRKLYGLYHVLKRYKDILFGRVVVVDSKMMTVLKRHREAMYLSPLLGKWLVLIQCFALKYVEGDRREPEKLLGFLQTHRIIPPKSLGQTKAIAEDLPVVEPINVVEKAKLFRLNTLKLNETEYAETITTVVKNIEGHQKNDLKNCRRNQKRIKGTPRVQTRGRQIISGDRRCASLGIARTFSTRYHHGLP